MEFVLELKLDGDRRSRGTIQAPAAAAPGGVEAASTRAS
jgi:hypothetical protein